MNPNKKGKISYTLQIIYILPLLCFGIAVILFGTNWFTRVMYDEVEVELGNVAHNVATLFDVAYPGDYRQEEGTYRLYKGDHDITEDYRVIDRVREDTNLDVTLFYQDTRVLTTIVDSSDHRIIGSDASADVTQGVLMTGESHFYNNASINGIGYFAYYMPLRNSDNTIVGMIFVGKPSKQVNQAIRRSVYPLLIAAAVAMLVMTVCIFLYTRRFTSVLMKLHHFISCVSNGNLNTDLDSSIVKRNDELGDIGRSALNMEHSLRIMLEHDTLTKLYNRRYGDRMLHQVITESTTDRMPFCVSIGDIDFFKRVNDTYGHECGDIVLKNIAGKLRTYMEPCGFVARWGGEEFLLVFRNTDMTKAHRVLEELLDDIRAMESSYNGQTIKVTMTFGLVSGDTNDVKHLIRRADEKLYEGKTSGRNRIVT